MIRLNEKSLFTALLFVFTAVLMWNTIGMRSDVVLVPRIVGTILLVFSGVQLLIDLFPAIASRLSFLSKSSDGSSTIGGEGVVEEETETKEERRSRFLFIVWMVLFVALTYYIGMIYAIVVSLFIYLKWISKQSWRLSILYSLITALIVYLSFVVGLDVYYFM
ncbi:tripartite tricarboxylate transporter TctB family protein [Paenibacillus abyssi]|uniref:DUF1468 domain-containing protein n=1 Tax=Paenibacillus abyssi TaxID=1340531 RepID=A0A917FR28_9BACL|nr:tripartite tricarboxylate transporter TctB family protein [Paenibacillus abyssi]GGG00999.1 hypothetical protein GCM10010916_17710 [Paenibacillus abyssi]